MATIFVPPDNIVEVASPPFFTLLFNGGLQGILAIQVYIYHIGYPKDSIYTKILVYVVFAVETFQTGVVVDSVVERYSRPPEANTFDKVAITWLVPPLTAIVTFLVECYYAFRIKIITRSFRVPIIVVAIVIQLAGGLATGYFAKKAVYYSQLNTPENLLAEGVNTGLWNFGSTVCDLIIAIYMTYYLSKFDVKIRQTKALLNKVIRLTIETGTVTTILSIVTFILATVPGIPTYYQIAMGTVGKVYANSLLVLLNSRLDFVFEDTRAGVETVPIHFKTGPSVTDQTTDTYEMTSGVKTTTFDPQIVEEVLLDDSEKAAVAHSRVAPSELVSSIP